MKIAYLYTAIVTRGGADRMIIQKANYLAEKYGYEVYIITDSQAGRPPVFPLSPLVKHIDLEIDFDEQYRYGFLKRGVCYFRLMNKYKKKLSRTLNEIRPDIVMTTLGRDLDFLTSLHDGSKKIGESHIAKHFSRNFHLMEQRGIPYRWIARYWRKKQERAVGQLDALVVLTQQDAREWEKIKEAVVIPNPAPFIPQESSTCTGHKIISVGRLSEQKGYDMLIEAWTSLSPKYPDWEIDVYGEGELHDRLQKKIDENGIQKSFHLKKPVDTIADKYLESAFYVMSSRFEGFGLVLIEAMACGLPCISFDCPYGPADIITNRKDGLLIENGNIEQLANGIRYLIEQEEVRKEMGQKAKQAVQRYQPDKIMRKWDQLFKSISNRI